MLGLVAHPIKGAFVSYDKWKRKGNDPLRTSRLQMGQDALHLSPESEQQEVLRSFEKAILRTDERKAEMLREAELSMQNDEDLQELPTIAEASRSAASTPVPPYEEKRDHPAYSIDVQERHPTPPHKDTTPVGFFL